jgi:hypothetical protein
MLKGFHLGLATLLQERCGIETDIVNGRCEVVGVPKHLTLGPTKRQQMAYEWLEKQGFKVVKPWHVAAAFHETRPKQRVQPGQHNTQSGGGQQQSQQQARSTVNGCKIPKGQGVCESLKVLWEGWVKLPWKVVYEGVKAGLKKDPLDPHAHEVRNIDVFLYEVSKRSRAEGHLAALREIRWGSFRSINDALLAAEIAYKKARRPKVELERGAKIIVSHMAAPTDEQKQKLERLAEKRGWSVVYEQKKSQRQQQTQKQGMTP